MSCTKLAGIGTIWSGKSTGAAGKTLIVSAHGRMTGTTFKPAYATALQFASGSYGALIAALSDAITGNVTAVDVEMPGGRVNDHALAWYEHDPSTSQIVTMLASGKCDVLTIDPAIQSTRRPDSPTLSGLIGRLNQGNLTYPAILGLFCRVVKNVATGETLMSHTVVGGRHATAAQQGAKMKDAISIAQELKATGRAR